MPEVLVKDKSEFYEIRIRGYIDTQWEAWFDDLTVIRTESGETKLSGYLVDQSALHGLLAKIRDLNLPLLSVTQAESKHDQADKNENQK